MKRKSDGNTSVAETPDKGDRARTIASPRRQQASLAIRRKASFYSGVGSRNVMYGTSRGCIDIFYPVYFKDIQTFVCVFVYFCKHYQEINPVCVQYSKFQVLFGYLYFSTPL